MLSGAGMRGAPFIRARGSIWKGIAVGLAINAGALVLGVVTIAVVVGALVLIGFPAVQFAWIVPLYLRYRAAGETETAKGFLVAAGLCVLLSFGCWGFIISLAVRH